MEKQFMGIDQYGKTYHSLGAHPRKTLCERLGTKHADKMYVDLKTGEIAHIGYIVGGMWVTLYEVTPVRNIQK